MNKGTYKFKYPISEHYKRLEWLRENANIPHKLNEVYDYENKEYTGGSVEYELTLDAATYGKYLKYVKD